MSLNLKMKWPLLHALALGSFALAGWTACGDKSSSSAPAPTVSAPAPNAPTNLPVTTGNGTTVNQPSAPSSTLVSFATVAPIIARSCGCHGSRDSLPLVGNQAMVDAHKKDIYDEVNSGAMPLNRSMNATDRALLLKYAAQR